MDRLFNIISKYPHKTILTIEWPDGLKVKGSIDMCYKTNNGLKINQKGFKEYEALSLEVLEVLSDLEQDDQLEVGSFLEISIIDKPSKVYLQNGSIIWQD